MPTGTANPTTSSPAGNGSANAGTTRSSGALSAESPLLASWFGPDLANYIAKLGSFKNGAQTAATSGFAQLGAQGNSLFDLGQSGLSPWIQSLANYISGSFNLAPWQQTSLAQQIDTNNTQAQSEKDKAAANAEQHGLLMNQNALDALIDQGAQAQNSAATANAYDSAQQQGMQGSLAMLNFLNALQSLGLGTETGAASGLQGQYQLGQQGQMAGNPLISLLSSIFG